MSLRSALYALARLLGWINAAQRGPTALATRYVRSKATGAVMGQLSRAFRRR